MSEAEIAHRLGENKSVGVRGESTKNTEVFGEDTTKWGRRARRRFGPARRCASYAEDI